MRGPERSAGCCSQIVFSFCGRCVLCGSNPLSPRAKQVPPIAFDIEEDDDLSIFLVARSGQELDSGLGQPRVCSIEVVNPEKQPDPSCKLLAHDGFLTITVGACEQYSRHRTGGTDDNPPLRPAVVRQRGYVFHEIEAQHTNEEIDCRFIFPNDQREELEM